MLRYAKLRVALLASLVAACSSDGQPADQPSADANDASTAGRGGGTGGDTGSTGTSPDGGSVGTGGKSGTGGAAGARLGDGGIYPVSDAGPGTTTPVINCKDNSTYYVDNRAGCNDSNPGTSAAAPWCTFKNVNAKTFNSGDCILLARGGSWSQALRTTGAGTPSAWITLGAYGTGPRPIIRGNDAAGDRTVILTNPDYWAVDDLEISHAGEGILVDYTSLGHAGLSFRNIYVHDVNTTMDRKPLQSDFPGIQNSAAITIGADVAAPSATQWVVKDITVDGLEAFNTQGFYMLCGGGLLTATDYSSFPPHSVRNLVVKNSYFHDMPAPGFCDESTTDSFYYSNRIDCSGHKAEPQGTTCFFTWLMTNAVIANNTLDNMSDTVSNDESALDLEGFLDKMLVRGNYFSKNAGSAIEFLQLGRNGDYHTNNEVSSNAFVANGAGYGMHGTSLWEVTFSGNHPSGTIRDNLFPERNGLTSGYSAPSFTGFTFTNNTPVSSMNLYNAPTGFSGVQGQNQWSYQTATGSSFSDIATYDSAGSRWTSGSGYIDRFNQIPDNCDNCGVARTWTASTAGTISIRGRVFKNDTAGGDGVKVAVLRNATTIWPTTAMAATIGATDPFGLDTNLDSVSVVASDQIHFVVYNGGSNANDLTSWTPTVAGSTDNGGCDTAGENGSVNLSCPAGKKITQVVFASYGTAMGACGSYTVGSCNASNSRSVVEGRCLGQQSCTVPAANATFGGDPCGGTAKSLTVQVVCG